LKAVTSNKRRVTSRIQKSEAAANAEQVAPRLRVQ
jgi:hypothetical protein